MKRIIYIPILIVALLYFQPESVKGQGFTLEQCIDYALANSVSVENATLDEQIANARVKETVGIGLPQINGSVGVNYNQQLSRFFGVYTPGFGFLNPDPVPPTLNEGDVLAGQNFFQLKASGNASLSINQLLFSGSYIVGLQAANAYKELAVKTTGQSREQVVSQVTKAYYLAITNRERVTLFDSNISRVDSLLRTTKAMLANGFSEQIEVDRVQVTYNNLVTERAKFLNQQSLAIELLKFQMNYPMSESLDLEGSLDNLSIPDLSQYVESVEYSRRWDYQVLSASKALQEYDLKNMYAATLPSLSGYVNLGYSTQSPDLAGVFKTNTDIPDENGLGPDKWYPSSSLGVTLNVPIFGGLQQRYRIQQSRLNLYKMENQEENLQSAIELEVKTARITFDNAVKTLELQQENLGLAENVARVTKIKYEEGVGSSLEVIDAESGLREAQINHYNALYEALVAKVDLDKAFGNLLPIDEN